MSNTVFDFYLPVLRNKLFWIPVYVFIISFLFFRYKKAAWLLLLFLILTLGAADIISSHLIKKNVERIRPCNVEQLHTIPRVSCGSGYSFTSSHAANHFALSVFLILSVARRRSVKGILFFWAFIVSFSQVYVGVHYPLDVIMGALLGTFIAFVFYYLYKKSEDNFNKFFYR
jgi:undecaprenyl-diphosphatase